MTPCVGSANHTDARFATSLDGIILLCTSPILTFRPLLIPFFNPQHSSRNGLLC